MSSPITDRFKKRGIEAHHREQAAAMVGAQRSGTRWGWILLHVVIIAAIAGAWWAYRAGYFS
jgi:hypothetical protein